MRFLQFFIKKFGLKVDEDNTPQKLLRLTANKKVEYLHHLVAQTLKDLLVYFNDSSLESDATQKLLDHPLQEGRRNVRTNKNIETASKSMSQLLDVAVTAALKSLKKSTYTRQFIEAKSVDDSSSYNEYFCKICKFKSRYETLTLAHIETCLEASGVTSVANEALVTLSSTEGLDFAMQEENIIDPR